MSVITNRKNESNDISTNRKKESINVSTSRIAPTEESARVASRRGDSLWGSGYQPWGADKRPWQKT